MPVEVLVSGSVVAVTGANGFIGSALVRTLVREPEVEVRPIVRSRPPDGPPDAIPVGTIGSATSWQEALRGADTVVHLAGISGAASERDLEETNVQGTIRLAHEAVAAGVRRLVYLSSVKAMAEETAPGAPLTAETPPNPRSAYGRSKRAAEVGLESAAAVSPLEVVVIRPPLVYGRGAGGNFDRLARLVGRGIPLPFGSLVNLRSMVSLANLIPLVSQCCRDAAAAGGTFLVSDGADLSTPELVRIMAEALGRRPRLLPVPPGLIRLAGAATGREEQVSRLTGTLQVDITRTTETLGWRPVTGPREAIREALRGTRPDPRTQF